MARRSRIIVLTVYLFFGAGAGFSAKRTNAPLTYIGMCDASAAVEVDGRRFVAASDEDNMLRVYRSDAPGKAVTSFDAGLYLNLKVDDKNPEVDIEGGTRINERTYWIGSHGRNKKGLVRPNRHRLFAVDLGRDSGGQISFVSAGTGYKNLIEDLIQEPRMSRLGLREASQLEVRQANRLLPTIGGINIEGLACNPQTGALLIGFRNPRPLSKALVVVLENPDSVLLKGAKPRFGDPILLDLQGLGIRSMEFSDYLSAYLIIAGSHNAQKGFKLFKWSGAATDRPIVLRETKELNGAGNFMPEALIDYSKARRLHVLSDDGDVEMWQPNSESNTEKKSCKCKDLADPEMKRFRGLWISVD